MINDAGRIRGDPSGVPVFLGLPSDGRAACSFGEDGNLGEDGREDCDSIGSGWTVCAKTARNAGFCDINSSNGNKMTVASIGWPEKSSFIGGGAAAGRKAEKMEDMVEVKEGGVSSYMSRYALQMCGVRIIRCASGVGNPTLRFVRKQIVLPKVAHASIRRRVSLGYASSTGSGWQHQHDDSLQARRGAGMPRTSSELSQGI